MFKQLMIISSVLFISSVNAAPPAPAPSSNPYSDDSGSLRMTPPAPPKGAPVSGKPAVQTGVVDTGDSLQYVVDPATQTQATVKGKAK